MKCRKCGKKIGFEFTCGKCKLGFCSICRLPEDHECAKMAHFVQQEKVRLNKVLESAASEETHNSVKM